MKTQNRFRLQRVLDVRELIEKERQKELSSSRRRLKAEETNLKQLERDRSEASQGLQTIDKAEVSRFQNHHAYLTLLNEKIANKRQELESIKGEVEQKRRALLDAIQERKVLDKLKMKQAKAAVAASNKLEQTFGDEVAIRRRDRR